MTRSIQSVKTLSLALVAFVAATPAMAQVLGGEATFEGLGDLPGGTSISIARDVSADGAVVVGASNSESGSEAFRWEDGVMEGLGDLRGGDFGSGATGVSADGSVVVGSGRPESGAEPFRWEAGIMEGLGLLPGATGPGGVYFSVSDDGSVVVGTMHFTDKIEAFRWENGTMVGLGDLPGGNFFSAAKAVSSDGSIIVGVGYPGDDIRQEAVRWVNEEIEGLGYMSEDGGYTSAYGVSPDGSVVVGYSSISDSENEAFRWEDGTMVGLGDLPGGTFYSVARDVSADGSMVIGVSRSGEGPVGAEAFIWTEESGMQNLKHVLENEHDLDLTGWTLIDAEGISDDGTVIVGWGMNPDGGFEAWRAEAPFTVAEEASPEALADVLSAPSPNPAHETSTITLAVERGQHVSVEVFDVTGRRVQRLYDGQLAAGMSETFTLNASTLPAGVYVIRATGEDFAKSRRVTVVR